MFNTAHAYNFIDVNSNFATSTLGYASGLFGDFSTPIYLILGVIVFGALLYALIGAFTKH